MPDYAKGKIYTLRTTNNPDLVYVGSTCQPLSKRFAGHKSATQSKGDLHRFLKLPAQIINCGGAYIELHEECPCDSKEQLLQREGQVMRELNSGNTRIAGRTNKEYCQDKKEMIEERRRAYREANKEKVQEKTRAYEEANKERIREKKRAYYEANCEKKRAYEEANKERIRERKRAYCEANKGRIREKKCAYYEANKEVIREKGCVYREANKEVIQERNRTYYLLQKAKTAVESP